MIERKLYYKLAYTSKPKHLQVKIKLLVLYNMTNEGASGLQCIIVSLPRLTLSHKWVHQSTLVKSIKQLNQQVVTSCSFSNKPFGFNLDLGLQEENVRALKM